MNSSLEETVNRSRTELIRLFADFSPGVRVTARRIKPTIQITSVEDGTINGTMSDRRKLEWSMRPGQSASGVQPQWHIPCRCGTPGHCPHLAAILEFLLTARLQSVRPAAVSVEIAPEQDGELISLVRRRVGSPMTREDVRFLEEVQRWKDRMQQQVAVHDLVRLCRKGSYYDPRSIDLFPPELPPQNELEYLTCAVAAAEALKKSVTVSYSVPKACAAAADRQWLKDFRLRWAELAEIREWRRTLRSWEHETEYSAVASDTVVELRLLLTERSALIQQRPPGKTEFTKITIKALRQLEEEMDDDHSALSGGTLAILRASLENSDYSSPENELLAGSRELARCLQELLSVPSLAERHVAGEDGAPLERFSEPLHYELVPPAAGSKTYELRILTADGEPAPPPVSILRTQPPLYVTAQGIWTAPPSHSVVRRCFHSAFQPRHWKPRKAWPHSAPWACRRRSASQPACG